MNVGKSRIFKQMLLLGLVEVHYVWHTICKMKHHGKSETMKFNDILSSDLPEIDESVKQCVNFGQWLLFRSSSIDKKSSHAHLYLKTDEQILELDPNGRILKEVTREKVTVHIDEICYFSDIPRPQSLSNAHITVF